MPKTPTRIDLEPTPLTAGLIRMPRRTPWFDLPEEYGEAGMKIKVWCNYEPSILEGLDLGKRDDLIAFYQKVFLEHNGWADQNGVPYPAPTTAEFWKKVPPELLDVLSVVFRQARESLPNLMAQRGGS